MPQGSLEPVRNDFSVILLILARFWPLPPQFQTGAAGPSCIPSAEASASQPKASQLAIQPEFISGANSIACQKWTSRFPPESIKPLAVAAVPPGYRCGRHYSQDDWNYKTSCANSGNSEQTADTNNTQPKTTHQKTKTLGKHGYADY